MHKLSKGLKKKIKGKKGKEKEDDLFDPAILEQYRRDKAAAAAAAAATLGEDHDPSAEENGSPTTSEAAAAAAEPDKNQDSEEWQKFKLLTSGKMIRADRLQLIDEIFNQSTYPVLSND